MFQGQNEGDQAAISTVMCTLLSAAKVVRGAGIMSYRIRNVFMGLPEVNPIIYNHIYYSYVYRRAYIAAMRIIGVPIVRVHRTVH